MRHGQQTRLQMDPIPGCELVSVCLALSGPEACEGPGTLGFSGLWMETVRAGAGVLSEAGVSQQFDEWGSGLNAFCQSTVCGLKYSCRPEVLEDSLRLLAKLFPGAKAPLSIFERERGSREALIKEERDDPASDGLRRMRERILAGTPLASSPLGTEEDLSLATPVKLKHFGESLWEKGTVALGVSGDFSPTVLGPLALALFPLEQAPDPRQSQQTPGSREDRFEEVVRHAREQAVVVHGFSSCGYQDDDFQYATLALACLNGLSGPLFEEIRERHGLAYYCSARMVSGRDRGLIAFVSGCEESKSKFLLERLQEIFLRLGVGGFSQDEFQCGVAQIRSGLRMNRQRTSWRSQRIAIRSIQELPVDLGEREEDFLATVRPEELSERMSGILCPGSGSSLFLLPESP